MVIKDLTNDREKWNGPAAEGPQVRQNTRAVVAGVKKGVKKSHEVRKSPAFNEKRDGDVVRPDAHFA
jgi:hypothetical protein